MKTTWLVIDQGRKASSKPYVRQYLLFEKDADMVKYITAAGYVGEVGAMMRDVGMVNFCEIGDVNLRIMRLEVK